MKKLCCIFNYAPHYRLPIYRLMDKNFDVDFFFGNKLRNNEKIEKLDFKELKGFKKELNVHFIYHNYVYMEGLAKIACSKEYDKFLISPNINSLSQWLFLFVCFLLKKNVYTWWHGIAPGMYVGFISKIKLKLYEKLVYGNFIYGEKAIQNMVKFGYRPEKLHAIYNSLDYEKTLVIRKKLSVNEMYRKHFNNDNKVILFIGRLTAVKKLDMIVRSQQILKREGTNINVIFIGDGPIKQQIQDTIPTDSINCFWFYGSLYEEQKIAELLYNADICVSPGNVGLTALHALSYGLPVVTNNNFTTQMPEHEVILKGLTGDFFEDGDIDSLCSTISGWFNKNMDRDEIRKQCYKVIDEKWNPFIQIDIIKSVLKL